MSRYVRNRREAYDNIAVGSATGHERLKGTLSSELYSQSNLAVGSAFSTTDPHENLLAVASGSTKDNENVDTTSNIST